MSSVVLVIEDSRAQNTWLEIARLISSCACRGPAASIAEIRSLRGPVEGYRLCNAVKSIRAKHGSATIALLVDTDRYGTPASTMQRLNSELSRCFGGRVPRGVQIVPVIEKLEDWVYALIKSEPCRCCGVEGLSTLLGTKYEKYMAATRLPRLLSGSREQVCSSLRNRGLTASMGIARLINILC